MIKLFIDDIRKSPSGWTLARTVTEAIRILDTQYVTECSLDHDISHQVMMEDSRHNSIMSRPYPCNETFEPVARYLGATHFAGPITLHTANPAGAERMRLILLDNGLTNVTVRLGRPANGLEERGGLDGG